MELKLAAIKNLEFEEFSSYMTYDQIFNHKFYSKVSHDLSPESQAFWDEIIMQFSGQSLEDISFAMNVKDEFFQHCSVYFDPDIGRKDNNYYVNKAGFNKLKKNLPNCKVDFKLADFEEFPDVADGQYDLIMLSNIFDYSLSTVFFSVLEELNDNHLTEDGLIQAHYTFGEKEEGKRKFIYRLEDFTASRQAKNIRLDIRDVGANQGKVEKFFFKRRSAANIMLQKSDFGTYPELDGK